MTLTFISGNQHKFKELKAILSELEMKNIDLPEIQHVNPKIIIESKITEALKHHQGPIIVEDTSLYFQALGEELPGPLIKRFVKSMGSDGLADLTQKLGNTKAIAKTLIGYAPNPNETFFFEGIVYGDIVSPKVSSAFGWDPIFQPLGYTQTFAEMGIEQKNQISQRTLAAQALKTFLEKEKKSEGN